MTRLAKDLTRACLMLPLMLVGLAAPAWGQARPHSDEIASLIAELADDDQPWNAIHATWALHEQGGAAAAALQDALDSNDRQQRQLAAHLLRRIESYQPTDRLLEVTVEGLADDSLPREQRAGRRHACVFVFNAKEGTLYLLEHARRAERYLVEGLQSGDAQQRFLCAFILGRSGRTGAIDDAAPLLIEHLRDNDIRNDAMMSAAALYGFGVDVLPYLAAAVKNADQQQFELIRLITLDITDPPTTPAALRQRKRLHHVTQVYHDPIIEFDVHRHGLPYWRWQGQ